MGDSTTTILLFCKQTKGVSSLVISSGLARQVWNPHPKPLFYYYYYYIRKPSDRSLESPWRSWSRGLAPTPTVWSSGTDRSTERLLPSVPLWSALVAAAYVRPFRPYLHAGSPYQLILLHTTSVGHLARATRGRGASPFMQCVSVRNCLAANLATVPLSHVQSVVVVAVMAGVIRVQCATRQSCSAVMVMKFISPKSLRD